MPLIHNEDTGRMTLALNDDGRQAAYAVETEFCDNPVCQYGTCTMALIPDPESGGEPKIVALDLFKQKLDKNAQKKAGPADRPFAGQVLKNLTREDFALLYQCFYRYKESLTRSADPEKLDTVFPAEEIEFVDSRKPVSRSEAIPLVDLSAVSYYVDSRTPKSIISAGKHSTPILSHWLPVCEDRTNRSFRIDGCSSAKSRFSRIKEKRSHTIRRPRR